MCECVARRSNLDSDGPAGFPTLDRGTKRPGLK